MSKSFDHWPRDLLSDYWQCDGEAWYA